jgi:limonene-1,2-epoxide hydrolase
MIYATPTPTPSHPILAQWMSAWASHYADADAVANLFTPDAIWVIDGETLHGLAEIRRAVGAALHNAQATKFLLRRSFGDLAEPTWHAAEWALRVQQADGSCRECEQAVLINVVDGQIKTMRTHNDKLRACAMAWDAPLRPESRPSTFPKPQRTMTLDEVLNLQQRHVMQGWRVGAAEVVTAVHMPQSVILNAWETVHGHDEIRVSVQKYFANYADTQVEVHRVVYDGQNIAVNQTWCCTNRLTGKRAGDQDLIIGVLQDDHIWYWREYFDGTLSAQTLEQTHFGMLQHR